MQIPTFSELSIDAKHQALLRSYQGCYVLLPTVAPQGDIIAALTLRYDARAMLSLSLFD